MNRDQVIAELKRWGHAQVNRYCLTFRDRNIHMLGQAREMAPGSKENAARPLIGRDGYSRRKYMARGIDGISVIPKWAVDPVRSANDAGRPKDNAEIAVDQGIPSDLLWVSDAIIALGKHSPIQAGVAKIEYCESAPQSMKARMAATKYGGKLSLWQYRKQLDRAIEFIASEARHRGHV